MSLPSPIHDIVVYPPKADVGYHRGEKRNTWLAVATVFLIIAVFANGTLGAFADEASSTSSDVLDQGASSTVSDIVPTDTANTANTADTAVETQATSTAMSDTSSVSSTPPLADGLAASSTDTEALAATSTEPDFSASSTLVVIDSTSTPDGAASTTPPLPDASIASSTEVVAVTGDATGTVADASTTSPNSDGEEIVLPADIAPTSSVQADIPVASTTDIVSADTVSANAVKIGDIRNQVRAELEKKLSAEYNAQLQEALAKQQDTLNATEQADMKTMRDELTTEIKQQLSAGCLTFSDGSYFCVGGASSTSAAAYAAPAAYARVYSEKDASGIQQIFIQSGGSVTQLTHSVFDNIQPVWNKDQSLIAWQGLVNDRWQIFINNRATGATQMISDGAGNSINPAIDGNRVAWQGWDNNWEIYLAQPPKLSTDANWQVNEITHDTWANVEPQLAAGLLAWQSYRGGSWQIFVDDLATGAISQVSTGSGVNTDPKFLLTWSNQENGQAQTLQYDISSGAVSTLGASTNIPTPAPLPVAPADKNNNAALPASGGTSSSSTATSTKSQGDGDNPTLN